MSANEEQLAAFAAGAEERFKPYLVAAKAFIGEMLSVDGYANELCLETDTRALALLLRAYEERGFDDGFDVMVAK